MRFNTLRTAFSPRSRVTSAHRRCHANAAVISTLRQLAGTRIGHIVSYARAIPASFCRRSVRRIRCALPSR
jgi:hypothetical protein